MTLTLDSQLDIVRNLLGSRLSMTIYDFIFKRPLLLKCRFIFYENYVDADTSYSLKLIRKTQTIKSSVLSHKGIIMTSTNNDRLWTVISNSFRFQRCNFACGAYKDRYVLIAGGNGLSQLVTMYDVTKKSCIVLPNLPYTGFCRGLVLNNYFYVTDSGSRLFRICLSRQRGWELVARRERMRDIIAHDNRIYFINFNSEITCIDPTTNEFIPIASSIHLKKFQDFSSVVVGDKIYLLGERRVINVGYENEIDKKMAVFDIVNNRWSEEPPLPILFDQFTAIAVDRWIVVSGMKYDDKGSTDFVYDTCTQEWTQHNATLSSHRRYHRYIKVGSHIITVGGENLKRHFCPMTAIHIKHVIPEFTWIMLKPYIFLRRLIDDGRAAPILKTENLTHVDSDINTDTNAYTNAVVEKLFMDTPLDIFRDILLYLN